MDIFTHLIHALDPVLIAPYRWFQDPVIGWLIGTFVLALWASMLGLLTLSLAYRVNRVYVKKELTKTGYYHEQSLKAKAAGDEEAYKKINSLANEEFSRSFFLLMAMGMASLWPAFFAAAWLHERFGDMTFFALPAWAGGYHLNFIGPFVGLYILARFVSGKCKTLIINMFRSSPTAFSSPGASPSSKP
jgi:hypothetical protein